MSLKIENEIYIEAHREQDIIMAGLQYSLIGNYIDFGVAVKDVREDVLNHMIEDRHKISLNDFELKKFKKDLAIARNVVYITDNAGEIIFDKIFIRIMKEKYPCLNFKVICRGGPVQNDATIDDIYEVGIDNFATVIESGTDLPGCPVYKLARKARTVMEEADVCIAKGIGNTEALRGCNKNIYYLFLCKCRYYQEKYNLPEFTPIFSNERRIGNYEWV